MAARRAAADRRVLAVAAAASAGAVASPAAAPAEGGTFTVVIPADPGSLDPHMSVFTATNTANSFAYETLVYLGPDGEIVPGWRRAGRRPRRASPTRSRTGSPAPTAAPLTASTVAENFSFVSDPANQSPLLGVYVPPGITVEADDAARTVTLTSETPVPFLLQNTGAGLFIVCAAGLADRSILAAGTDGTGPFVLEEAVANDHYTYRARDDYAWGPDGATSEVRRVPVRGGSAGRRERVDGGQPAAVRRGQRGPDHRTGPPARRERGLLLRREPDPSSESSSSTRWKACRPPTSPCGRP